MFLFSCMDVFAFQPALIRCVSRFSFLALSLWFEGFPDQMGKLFPDRFPVPFLGAMVSGFYYQFPFGGDLIVSKSL